MVRRFTRLVIWIAAGSLIPTFALAAEPVENISFRPSEIVSTSLHLPTPPRRALVPER